MQPVLTFYQVRLFFYYSFYVQHSFFDGVPTDTDDSIHSFHVLLTIVSALDVCLER